MIDSQDVNEEELQILKGDAIGDNLCSEKWMITTLMSLCKVVIVYSFLVQFLFIFFLNYICDYETSIIDALYN